MRRLLALLSILVAGTALAADGTAPPANRAALPAEGSALSADRAAQAPAGRELFLAAMQRVRTGQSEPPDPPALADYPIYDYLLAARLRRDLAATLDDSMDPAIDAFMRAHAGEPVARSVQNVWLASLARRRRWSWFLPRSADSTDPAILCSRLAGRLATGDTAGLAADALARWSMPQAEPPECTEIFSWLRAQGLLTSALRDSRARTALAQDKPALARDFIADVPADRAAPLREWLELLEDPKASLTRLAASPQRSVESEALLAGFNRLSRANPDTALALLPSLAERPDMTPALLTRMRRAAALGAAFGRLPEAVAAFNRLPDDAIDTSVEEWRVRAALWAGDFERALSWIEQMPSGLGAQPRWRYWRARALAAIKGPDAAAPAYAEIATLRDYYGYLAADRLNQGYHLNIRPSADDAPLRAAFAAESAVVRAHALYDCDMVDEAGAEWSAALAAAKPAMKVQAARLASSWGWYAQAILTLAQSNEWDDVMLRYPRPYEEIIARASKLAQVPPDWILAIMRQESLFRRDAVSRADARGLMQMLPATASSVARRWHMPAPGRDALFDPEIAVPLGAAYVRELLDRYGNQLALCLAAYNAGPLAVARWEPAQPIDADVWIENIPYTETRGYVQHILEHIVAFAVVSDSAPPRLLTLLPPVAPAAVTGTPATGAPDAAAGASAHGVTHRSGH